MGFRVRKRLLFRHSQVEHRGMKNVFPILPGVASYFHAHRILWRLLRHWHFKMMHSGVMT